MRELAFFLVLVRAFTGFYWKWQWGLYTMVIYLFLFLTVLWFLLEIVLERGPTLRDTIFRRFRKG
jgi:hypothetical protein